jgi:hypothetical protein
MIYLGFNIYIISDEVAGLVFVRCQDSFSGDYNLETDCKYLYRIDKEKLKYVESFSGKSYNFSEVKEGVDANNFFVIRLFDSQNKKQALLMVDKDFSSPDDFKLYPIKY